MTPSGQRSNQKSFQHPYGESTELRATLIKVPISGTTSDFDPLIAQCEISALRLA
jgi:hypothetical protein